MSRFVSRQHVAGVLHHVAPAAPFSFNSDQPGFSHTYFFVLCTVKHFFKSYLILLDASNYETKQQFKSHILIYFNSFMEAVSSVNLQVVGLLFWSFQTFLKFELKSQGRVSAFNANMESNYCILF